MDITILGIESSCDDTSAAVIRNTTLLSNVIASQAVHVKYGGVIPELASRAHEQNIVPVVDQAIKRAGITKEDIGKTITIEEYNKKFKVDDELLARLHQYAERDSVKPKDKEEFEKSLPQISLQMKALLARDLWDMNEYFQIINQDDEIVKKAMELLEFMGLADIADVKAGSLPYGVQRRLEIVRALATNPSLLLLDEPAAGMNPHETEELMENIAKIRDKFKIAILLIEHDMNLVMGICEGICVLNYGRIIAKGTAEEIQNNPVVIEAYLGKQKEG